ncbi:alkaline phosphatase D family protein [Aquimarina longa]|uniref:alkaline phosphatase D family protein n=1 Tax=Aquimarina longa TaxID=1080221 RepID=UPI0007833799|nr:alkaline phosphatase D family protein [Aquimarina longa]
MKYSCSFILIIFGAVQLSFSQDITEPIFNDFVIAFGSCNKQNSPQPFWDEIQKNNPDLFIWGGDNIYTTSDDISNMKNDYLIQNNIADYQKIKRVIPVMATWDDHDYGLNDGGEEWSQKEKSQQLFLDFLGVEKDSPRRTRKGIYTSKIFETEKGSVKVIILDTRYFRTPLKKSNEETKRYQPYKNKEGTLLGDKQWRWLEKELASNYSDFVIIVSSIQILSSEHGFETWGNFPHEVERLKEILVSKKVKNAILLSGDRHISEFSSAKVKGLGYPLIDFTSSGLTHSYVGFKGEPNAYRISDVTSVPSFGVLKFDFKSYSVAMQIRGNNNKVLQEYKIEYLKK